MTAFSAFRRSAVLATAMLTAGGGIFSSQQSTVAIALAAGSALTLLGGARANGQNAAGSPVYGFDPATYSLAHGGSGSGGTPLAPDAYFRGFNGPAAGDKPAQAANKSPPVDPYVAKAQAIFATDASGNYTNPRVGQIIDNTVKLSGSPERLKPYFDTLKPGVEQNIAFIVLDILANGGFQQQNKKQQMQDDYADFLGFIKGPSIVVYYKNLLATAQPTGIPEKEKFRKLAAELIGSSYPNSTTASIKRSPVSPTLVASRP